MGANWSGYSLMVVDILLSCGSWIGGVRAGLGGLAGGADAKKFESVE